MFQFYVLTFIINYFFVSYYCIAVYLAFHIRVRQKELNFHKAVKSLFPLYISSLLNQWNFSSTVLRFSIHFYECHNAEAFSSAFSFMYTLLLLLNLFLFFYSSKWHNFEEMCMCIWVNLNRISYCINNVAKVVKCVSSLPNLLLSRRNWFKFLLFLWIYQESISTKCHFMHLVYSGFFWGI